jgi:hypothetical protein
VIVATATKPAKDGEQSQQTWGASVEMAKQMINSGIEPLTLALLAPRSNQLS